MHGRYNIYKAIANDLDIAERCQMANQKMEDAQELMSLVRLAPCTKARPAHGMLTAARRALCDAFGSFDWPVWRSCGLTWSRLTRTASKRTERRSFSPLVPGPAIFAS